jgi:putative FmdB family regulatory protein
MPIYAYKCESCGHRQDVLQKISDPLLTVCPACSAATFTKQVTAAGFQLKGSGWYVTDFRDSGAKKDKEKDKDASATAGAEAAKTDAKPADAAAPAPAAAAAPAPAPAAATPAPAAASPAAS